MTAATSPATNRSPHEVNQGQIARITGNNQVVLQALDIAGRCEAAGRGQNTPQQRLHHAFTKRGLQL
ncbi:hypothetical protein [Candidatus Amarolinea dominans]|uniref:hypothetical protein n=1 Tax=Candidatus Amarolinea dominans TaxID=3140696 RepID=UPI0031364374|nr:hypothetical protein [Anaerolineae bacterium]